MQTTRTSAFALSIADQMIADRFARDYGIRTWADYLDYIDQRTTAHLPDHMAERVIRTAGQQRRNARLLIEDGAVLIAIPLHDTRTKETVWAELYLSTWLNVIECGADQAWFYAHKGADQAKGQVRTHIPLSHGERVTLTTIARVIGNAKVGQQARLLDRNPFNLRSGNVVVIGNPATDEGRVGRAKTETRAHSRDKLALRASLPKKNGQ